MPRKRDKARPRPMVSDGRQLEAKLVKPSSRGETAPILTSVGVARVAIGKVEQNKRDVETGRLAKAVVKLWGRTAAPVEADNFWRSNRELGPDDARQVPAYLATQLGSIVGWGVVNDNELQRLGGLSAEELSIFAPVRINAGNLAREALVSACGDNEAAFAGLCEPIPPGLVIARGNARWKDPEPLGIRLSEYPDRGTLSLTLDGIGLTIGRDLATPRSFSPWRAEEDYEYF